MIPHFLSFFIHSFVCSVVHVFAESVPAPSAGDTVVNRMDVAPALMGLTVRGRQTVSRSTHKCTEIVRGVNECSEGEELSWGGRRLVCEGVLPPGKFSRQGGISEVMFRPRPNRPGMWRTRRGPAWPEGTEGLSDRRLWWAGFGFYSKCSHSLELLNSGCLCCFHREPLYLLRAAPQEGAIISIQERTLTEAQGSQVTCLGSHRQDFSQDSSPGLSGTKASVPASRPAHLFWRDILGSLQRLWALVRGWCWPLPHPRELEAALGCLELAHTASAPWH